MSLKWFWLWNIRQFLLISTLRKEILKVRHVLNSVTLLDANTFSVPWEKAKLKVPLTATPWPTDRAERVGVNSFGIGGANAHVSHLPNLG